MDDPSEQYRICPDCNGIGEIYSREALYRDPQVCYETERCKECDGIGSVEIW